MRAASITSTLGNPVVQRARSDRALPVVEADFVAGPSDHWIVNDSLDSRWISRTYFSA
ncbi:hypothetical protein I547_2564 [Mycobacterium kansasii 824]|uniref:Uncharacterized protein n=2 Tax=Mycobacterium kansasii TaxID=1768 RepID=A0A1V3WWP0_MYCKA|nr:hypothetical protein MKAN_15215 [Mycobacterium kansasii ATCC 12478]EUA05424.1 hypothetical protein I547_2564 [Mycobacterium kansasii 824]OOK71379.1 hypothetical protein BZL29_5651 [Mycobacterium kansasii]OOK75453.1 hypothetical protein BZL30_4124 [Mycobacterium kansasii]